MPAIMSSNCSLIALILLYFIHLSKSKTEIIQLQLVTEDGEDPQNFVELKWHFSDDVDNLLYLEWKILNNDYFGRIDHYILKWNYTKLSCNPAKGEFGEERISADLHNFEAHVELYARYSIIFCVESDKVTCENFSKPFQEGDITTKIASVIGEDETPEFDWVWKNMSLDVYFETIPCQAFQGPLGMYYTAYQLDEEHISSISQYPLQNDHLVVQNLIPYDECNINIYFIRANDKVRYDFSFMPIYEVVTETIRNLTVTSQGPDHIALRWLPPDPPSDTLNEYYVYVKNGKTTSKHYAINIKKCVQWAKYHCHIIAITDGGSYNISIFALNRYDPGKVKLDIELEYAAQNHLYRNVETNIFRSKPKPIILPILECHTITKVSGQANVCRGDTIIDYKFSSDPVDSDIWTVEKYISDDPDWAFNIYRPDVVSVQKDGLHIKPKLEEELATTNLDLNPGCTQSPKKCHRDFVSIWNPPVVSGQLQSKKSFCFGNITIRAKLPIGDYMYPELYLEDVSNPQRRLLIAYARGNLDYVYINGLDYGGTKLFGGPHTDVKEPGKFRHLSTYVNSQHIGASWHTFNVIWLPDMIELYLDNRLFGHYDSNTVRATNFDKEFFVRLVLGIGVAGPYHFPNGYTSSNKKKPYSSSSKYAVKNFVENKRSWHNTWNEDSQLLVDFVTVTAL